MMTLQPITLGAFVQKMINILMVFLMLVLAVVILVAFRTTAEKPLIFSAVGVGILWAIALVRGYLFHRPNPLLNESEVDATNQDSPAALTADEQGETINALEPNALENKTPLDDYSLTTDSSPNTPANQSWLGNLSFWEVPTFVALAVLTLIYGQWDSAREEKAAQVAAQQNKWSSFENFINSRLSENARDHAWEHDVALFSRSWSEQKTREWLKEKNYFVDCYENPDNKKRTCWTTAKDTWGVPIFVIQFEFGAKGNNLDNMRYLYKLSQRQAILNWYQNAHPNLKIKKMSEEVDINYYFKHLPQGKLILYSNPNDNQMLLWEPQ